MLSSSLFKDCAGACQGQRLFQQIPEAGSSHRSWEPPCCRIKFAFSMALRAPGLSSSLPCAWLPVCIPFPTSCSDCFIKTILKATQPSVTQLYCSLFNQSPVSGQPGYSCPGLLCRGGFNTPFHCSSLCSQLVYSVASSQSCEGRDEATLLPSPDLWSFTDHSGTQMLTVLPSAASAYSPL